MPTAYEVLGADPGAGQDELWACYLAAVLLATAPPEADHRGLHALDAAWEALREPAARAAYDRGLEPGPSTPTPAWPVTPPAPAPAARREPVPGTPWRPATPPAAAPPAPASPAAPPPPRAPASPAAPPPPRAAAPPPAPAPRPGPLPDHASAPPARAHPGRMRRRQVSRPARHRSRRLVAGLLAGLAAVMLTGTAFVTLARLSGDGGPSGLKAGDCVVLSATEGTEVPCGSGRADGVLAEIVDDADGCLAYPQGHLVLGEARYGCLAPLP